MSEPIPRGGPAANAVAAVRRAGPEDAPGIVTLIGEVAAEGWLGIEAPHSVDTERRTLATAPRDDFAVWIAEDGGRVVGHLLLARGERPCCGHTAAVAVSVASRMRGRGLGGALLDAAVDWGAGHAVRKVCASVFGHNEAALRLFRHRGFKREGLRRAQFVIGGAVRDEVVLARFLG